jgi:hypothetical protein
MNTNCMHYAMTQSVSSAGKFVHAYPPGKPFGTGAAGVFAGRVGVMIAALGRL